MKLLLAAAVLIAVKCIIAKLCTYFPTVSFGQKFFSTTESLKVKLFSVFPYNWSRRNRSRQRPAVPRRHQHRPNWQLCERASNLRSVLGSVLAGIRRNSNQIHSNQDHRALEKVMKCFDGCSDNSLLVIFIRELFELIEIKKKSNSLNLK